MSTPSMPAMESDPALSAGSAAAYSSGLGHWTASVDLPTLFFPYRQTFHHRVTSDLALTIPGIVDAAAAPLGLAWVGVCFIITGMFSLQVLFHLQSRSTVAARPVLGPNPQLPIQAFATASSLRAQNRCIASLRRRTRTGPTRQACCLG